MHTKIITLTPEKAREFLKKNVHNRPLRKGRVEEYSARMKRGEWMLTGEGLIFDENGNLINGQHRCHAVIESGCSVSILIVYGAEAKVFDRLDQPGPRGNKDALAIGGAVNSALLAAALVWVYRESTGSFFNGNPTSVQVGELIRGHRDITESVRWTTNNKAAGRLLSPGMVAYAHYRAGKIDPMRRDAFFSRFSSGADLARSSVIYLLRERLVEDRAQRARMSATERLAITIKSINAYMTGTSIKSLRWRRAGDKPEDFPAWVKSIGDRNAGAA